MTEILFMLHQRKDGDRNWIKFGALQIKCNHWYLFQMEYTRLEVNVLVCYRGCFARVMGLDQAHECGRWDLAGMVFQL